MQIIIELEEKLRQAMIASDVEILNNLIDDSLVFIAPDGNIATKQMDLDAHKNKIQKISDLTPSEQKIELHDAFAVVSVKMELVGTFAESSISGTYRYLRIWENKNNGWKIVAGSVTAIH